MHRLFERVAVDFQKTEKMFVESDSFIVVAVEQPFAMEPGLVDQARKMDVAAELFVRTARMQSSHDNRIMLRAAVGRLRSEFLPRVSFRRLSLPATIRPA